MAIGNTVGIVRTANTVFGACSSTSLAVPTYFSVPPAVAPPSRPVASARRSCNSAEASTTSVLYCGINCPGRKCGARVYCVRSTYAENLGAWVLFQPRKCGIRKRSKNDFDESNDHAGNENEEEEEADPTSDPSQYELLIDNDSGTYRPNAHLLPLLKTYLSRSLPGLHIRTLDCGADEEEMGKLKDAQRERKKKGGETIVYTQGDSDSSVSSSEEEDLDRVERDFGGGGVSGVGGVGGMGGGGGGGKAFARDQKLRQKARWRKTKGQYRGRGRVGAGEGDAGVEEGAGAGAADARSGDGAGVPS
ncbi:hypothetical protein LTR35_012529 [Friedmanniomyces endolithicus]|nr:hypothetical protein LTR35_012529 [Friedmanniomyces endolithicus]